MDPTVKRILCFPRLTLIFVTFKNRKKVATKKTNFAKVRWGKKTAKVARMGQNYHTAKEVPSSC